MSELKMRVVNKLGTETGIHAVVNFQVLGY